MTAGRKTVGVLINGFDQSYQQNVRAGVEDAANALDIDVFYLNSGSIDTPYPHERMRNELHRFIRPTAIDGFFAVSTTVSSFSGPDGLANTFKDLYASVPVVVLGSPAPGVSSFSVDNRYGVREVMTHLIERHGRRRFVFVSGLGDNHDGNERRDAFFDTLAEYGLEPADPEPIRGDFNYDIAIAEFRKWLLRDVSFDAVVAANDESAFACFDAMRERGIRVPDDVSLAGFDDIDNSRFYDVPLTTVRQPLRELAREAVATLGLMISKGAPPVHRVFPTRAVIRQSCGCFSGSARSSYDLGTVGSSLAALAGFEDDLRSVRTAFGALREGHSSPGEFIAEFQTFLHGVQPDPKRFAAIEEFVSDLERFSADGPENASVCPRELALARARILVVQKAEAYQANRMIMHRQRDRMIQYSVARLMTSFSLESLLLRTEALLGEIGIKNVFISLFEPGTDNERMSLVFAYRDGARVSLPPGGIPFPTERFVPEGIVSAEKRFGLFVDTLFHEDILLGLLVLDIDIEAETWGDVITSQLRSALRASLLMEELVAKDERLNVAFRELSARADELERANRQIREDHERLLAAEKMASLGRLTAGIAHEMNTPLAAVRASLSELGNLVGEYRASAGDSEVTVADHLAIADDMERSVDIARRSAERASGFIRSIKGQTRQSDSSEPGVRFDLSKAITDSLVLLAHELKRGGCGVEFWSPEFAVMVTGKPDRLVQVITNLVMNAIDAMAPAGGTVSISLGEEGANAILTVSDTGSGMDQETRGRIFDPLFTTKPFGVGTGLGLTIVRDIITGDFCGTIDVSSVPGEGTTFTVTIPLIKALNPHRF
jgi:DNA-binding LacI/PurR family transcriptional regulator/signal transduction histidine kinase